MTSLNFTLKYRDLKIVHFNAMLPSVIEGKSRDFNRLYIIVGKS